MQPGRTSMPERWWWRFMAARRGISQGLLVTPVIIGLDATVTPLNAMPDVAAWLRWVY